MGNQKKIKTTKTKNMSPQKNRLCRVLSLLLLFVTLGIAISIITTVILQPSPLPPVSPTMSPSEVPSFSQSPSEAPSFSHLTIKDISLGPLSFHTCAITDINELKCWGRNFLGQLGDNTTINRLIPTDVNLGINVHPVQVSLGTEHTCVITTINTLTCWGWNFFGQIGDNTTVDRLMPTHGDLGNNVYPTKVSLGGFHSCVITNTNLLKCWGWNGSGALGDGTREYRSTPTDISLGGTNVYPTKVSLGYGHSCVVTNTNVLKCWGNNQYGQLGDGTTTDRLTPTDINVGPNEYPVQLSVGNEHTCIITNLKTLKCWGMNFYGQVGAGGTADYHSTPTTIYLGTNLHPTQISLGQDHTCAVTNTGVLKCWGNNERGGLGDGTTSDKFTPTDINLGTSVSYTNQVSLGFHHTCARTDTNTLMCWGSNGSGELGDGTRIDSLTPKLI